MVWIAKMVIWMFKLGLIPWCVEAWRPPLQIILLVQSKWLNQQEWIQNVIASTRKVRVPKGCECQKGASTRRVRGNLSGKRDCFGSTSQRHKKLLHLGIKNTLTFDRAHSSRSRPELHFLDGFPARQMPGAPPSPCAFLHRGGTLPLSPALREKARFLSPSFRKDSKFYFRVKNILGYTYKTEEARKH